MAICLEVAEHLTAARADTFVKDLCEASNMVLFGAAIPGQGGTNHINEQWQTYWHAKFLQNGFVALDLFKNAFWNDATFVDCPYYVTNTYLYVEKSSPYLSSAAAAIIPEGHWSIRVVHPNLFISRHFDTASFTKALRSVPKKLWAAFSRRLRKKFRV